MVKLPDSQRSNPRAHRGWMKKHQWVYEQHHGPIPKGCAVLFADGDSRNFDPDNLVCVTRAQRMRLNNMAMKGYEWWDRESLETVLTLAELESTIRERGPVSTKTAYTYEWRDRCLQAMHRNPDDKRHGTWTGYKCGCRCDACRDAAAEGRRMGKR